MDFSIHDSKHVCYPHNRLLRLQTRPASFATTLLATTGALNMNLEKVIFAFFIVLSLTLNFGFFIGELDDPNHHNVYELYAALVVSLIATIMKFGDRAHIGAVLLATSLVADLQLIAAVVVWTVSVHATDIGLTPSIMSSIVSLSGGALLANITSVIILVTETVMFRR
jgi:hypothetical protein